MPRHIADQDTNERRTEIARLLAAGLLRYHRRVQTVTSPATETTRNCLDVSPETSLNAATGPAVNAGGDPEKGTDDHSH